PPGAGKTLLARATPTILTGMTMEESLEVTKIYSVAGMLPADTPLIRRRPFHPSALTSPARSRCIRRSVLPLTLRYARPIDELTPARPAPERGSEARRWLRRCRNLREWWS